MHSYINFSTLSLVLIFTSSLSSAASSDFSTNAKLAADALQQWYNSSTGLWDGTGWWNSANCLTTLADLAVVDRSIQDITDYAFPTTLVKAQQYNLKVIKEVKRDTITSTYQKRDNTDDGATIDPNGFLNDYYDDEGWWALAWIRVYDVTGDAQYIEAAAEIFEDMKKGWSTPCGGGIWWDKEHTVCTFHEKREPSDGVKDTQTLTVGWKKKYVNAIANELFLSVAAHLANRMSNKQYYVEWAQKEWAWFHNSGMVDPNGNINDGLDLSMCKNNNGTVWSYNQGVVLGGLVELAEATDDDSYLRNANTIAGAAIAALTNSEGILTESCEPDCGGDASQFKGVFLRNLQALQQASPSDEIAQFIESNGISIWVSNRDGGNQLGLVWSGPYDNAASASTQSSALDALVAAVAVSQ